MLSRRASALMGMPRGYWAMISRAWKACWAVESTRPDPRRPCPVASGTATPFRGADQLTSWSTPFLVVAFLSGGGLLPIRTGRPGGHGRPGAKGEPVDQVLGGEHRPAEQ